MILKTHKQMTAKEVVIPLNDISLEGSLVLPERCTGIVLFAHGSGSSRFSPRNRHVSKILNDAGLATLLFDLLTKQEDEVDVYTRQYRFDIELLTERVLSAVDWTRNNKDTAQLKIGLFGSSTGSAAALIAASKSKENISAVVSRGGRPDLAGESLVDVSSPTLLIVGSEDHVVMKLNRDAYQKMNAKKELALVGGATHLFEEPGALEEVADFAKAWFHKYLI
jgi:dienelactone hydrolase